MTFFNWLFKRIAPERYVLVRFENGAYGVHDRNKRAFLDRDCSIWYAAGNVRSECMMTEAEARNVLSAFVMPRFTIVEDDDAERTHS